MPHETIVRAVLANGLQVSVMPQPHQRTVSIGLFLGHGSQHEEPETNGIAHFIEHVLFNPTQMPRRLSRSLAALLTAGASYQAHTTKEHTRFTITCLPGQVGQALRVLGLLARRRHVPEAAVEHERPIILQEHAMHFSSNAILRELLDYAFWGDSALGLFVLGRKENIQRFARRDLEERVEAYYAPDRAHIVVLAPLDPTGVVQAIAEQLEGWDGSAAGLGEPLLQTEPRVSALPTGHPRTDLYLGYLGVPFRSNDRPAMELLADVLGGGMRSRLFRALRETRKLAYLVHAFPVSYALGGYIAIRVECDTSNVREIFRAIQEEIDRLTREGVSREELEAARAARTTALLRILEDSAQHLQLLGRYATLDEEFFVDQEVRRLRTVEPVQVLRLTREMFVPDNLAIASLGPRPEDLMALF